MPDPAVTYTETNGTLTACIKPIAAHLGLSDGSSLLDIVKKELESGSKNFLIDMSELTALNSAGIGILIGCRKAVLTEGGKLRLSNVSGKISEIFRITKIESLFETN